MLSDLTRRRKRAPRAFALLTGVLDIRDAPPLPPEAERALAELEDALDLHGAPDPERTAAWLESEAEPAGAILAVVPRG